MMCELSEKPALFAASLKPALAHRNKIMEIWFFRSKSWMDILANQSDCAVLLTDIPLAQKNEQVGFASSKFFTNFSQPEGLQESSRGLTPDLSGRYPRIEH